MALYVMKTFDEEMEAMKANRTDSFMLFPSDLVRRSSCFSSKAFFAARDVIFTKDEIRSREKILYDSFGIVLERVPRTLKADVYAVFNGYRVLFGDTIAIMLESELEIIEHGDDTPDTDRRLEILNESIKQEIEKFRFNREVKKLKKIMDKSQVSVTKNLRKNSTCSVPKHVKGTFVKVNQKTKDNIDNLIDHTIEALNSDNY
jgi:hypothetical protein